MFRMHYQSDPHPNDAPFIGEQNEEEIWRFQLGVRTLTAVEKVVGDRPPAKHIAPCGCSFIVDTLSTSGHYFMVSNIVG